MYLPLVICYATIIWFCYKTMVGQWEGEGEGGEDGEALPPCRMSGTTGGGVLHLLGDLPLWCPRQ